MMNYKALNSIWAALLLALITPVAQADFIGLKVGGGIWDHDVSGSVRHTDVNNVDLKNDLKLGDEQDSYAFIVIEHPVPLIPNVKVSKTGLSTAGNGTVTTVFNYGGISYTGGASINSALVLDHQDVTLYYEILDNVVSIDVGVSAKILDGKVSITESGVTNSTPLTGTIPMLYGAAMVELPGTGFAFGMELSMLGIGDSEITDTTAKLVYRMTDFLGIEAGVRSMTIKLDALDAVYANMEFSGAFANVFLHF